MWTRIKFETEVFVSTMLQLGLSKRVLSTIPHVYNHRIDKYTQCLEVLGITYSSERVLEQRSLMTYDSTNCYRDNIFKYSNYLIISIVHHKWWNRLKTLNRDKPNTNEEIYPQGFEVIAFVPNYYNLG